jgi:hypothetical protein
MGKKRKLYAERKKKNHGGLRQAGGGRKSE